MKRAVDSWQEKLEADCLKFLGAYKRIRPLLRPPDGDLETVVAWAHKCARARLAGEMVYPPGSTGTKVVRLDRQFIQLLTLAGFSADDFTEGENTLPAGLCDGLEFAQRLALLLESSAEIRAQTYITIALLYLLLSRLWTGLWFEQFGDKPADFSKGRSFAAMCLETLAGVLRGRLNLPKGRINTELVGLVKVIESHAKQRMTPKEVHAAITHAGLAVPDAETFRVWLHRARERGLLNHYR